MINTLYRHWSKYQQDPRSSEGLVALDSAVEQKFWDFVAERMNVYHKKTAGAPFPWSEDEVLRANKFCNIYRELDRTTIAHHKMLCGIANDLPLFILNVAYMKWVGLPEVIEQIGLLSLDPERNLVLKQKFDSLPGTRFTSAYNAAQAGIMSVAKDRSEFIFEHLPTVAPRMAFAIGSKQGWSINDLAEEVAPLLGFRARFHMAEISMDIGYQRPELVDEFKPMFIGPGAEPAVKMLAKHSAEPLKIVETLMKTQPIEDINPLIVNGSPVFLTQAAVEQALCEYRKYFNLSNGTGLKGKTARKRLYKLS